MTRGGSGSWWIETPTGITLLVRIQSNAKRTEVAGVVEDELRIRISARPVEGAANRQLVQYLAKRLGIAKSRLSIVRGERSRHKTIAVEDPEHGLRAELLC